MCHSRMSASGWLGSSGTLYQTRSKRWVTGCSRWSRRHWARIVQVHGVLVRTYPRDVLFDVLVLNNWADTSVAMELLDHEDTRSLAHLLVTLPMVVEEKAERVAEQLARRRLGQTAPATPKRHMLGE